MIFKRSPKEGKVKAEVYINYGNDRVSISEAIVDPGTSVLEILKMVSDIRYTPDESATGHCGAMVTAINGFKNDLTPLLDVLSEGGERFRMEVAHGYTRCSIDQQELQDRLAIS